MIRLSDNAIAIANELHTARLDYNSEYSPLIDALNKLAEYEDAEENGLLVRLPCNVGDTVYSYCKEFGRILAYFIDEITIMYDTDNKDGLWVYDANCIEDYDLLNGIDFYKEDIGKTVFLTREEAEQVLNECEKTK